MRYLIIVVIVAAILIMACIIAELRNAPIEEEVTVEIDLADSQDVAEKKELIQQLMAIGYWIVEEKEVDATHEEYVLHGLVDNKH